MNTEVTGRENQSSKDKAKKDQGKEEKEEGDDAKEEKDEKEPANDEIEQTRLFVMNLSYQVTHEELREHFEKFGPVEHIEIPLRKGGKGQAAGFAYVAFKDTEAAISAFAQNDRTYF